MEKTRQIKILSIVALVLAVTAMTLGFAAFSATLNISSSATVTPQSSDFKIKIYGAVDAEEMKKIISGELSLDNLSLSDTVGAGYVMEGVTTLSEATINNNTLTISNIKATFEEDQSAGQYAFIIKNEGKYPAYLDISSAPKTNGVTKLLWEYTGECIPDTNTTPVLVDATCQYVKQFVSIFDENFSVINTEEDYYVIQPGEMGFLGIQIRYGKPATLADGPFDVAFPDVTLNFSTAKPTPTN